MKEIMWYFGNPLLMKKINSTSIMSQEWGVAGLHLRSFQGWARSMSADHSVDGNSGFCSPKGLDIRPSTSATG